jgi:DnaJ domain
MQNASNDVLLRAFSALGIPPTATLEEAKQAYRDLAQVWHPDRFEHNSRLKQQAEGKIREINTSYDLIVEYFSGSHGHPGESGPRASDRPGFVARGAFVFDWAYFSPRTLLAKVNYNYIGILIFFNNIIFKTHTNTSASVSLIGFLVFAVIIYGGPLMTVFVSNAKLSLKAFLSVTVIAVILNLASFLVYAFVMSESAYYDSSFQRHEYNDGRVFCYHVLSLTPLGNCIFHLFGSSKSLNKTN